MSARIETQVSSLSERWDDWPDAEAVVRRAVEAALADPTIKAPAEGEVSIALADDFAVQTLNRDYRGQDKPTNVLSFPTARGPLLGDIIIAHETLLREAKDDDLSPSDHLSHLTIHGLLHLLGYDHDTEAEAVAMEKLETAILARLGIRDPHAAGRMMPE
ncbi:MAG: rRNA maturation RNase YbeY [Alphaproteobacteria bacterium]